MSMNDPVADMLTRIRNGQSSGKTEVCMSASKLKSAVAAVLKDEGFIADAVVEGEGAKPELRVLLKYHNGQPVIEGIQRSSRPGRRVYRAKTELPKVIGGLGVAVVSTSRGVMSDRKARELGVGGEVLCTVW